MIELKGKYNIAKIFTNNIEENTQGQIINLLNQDFTINSKVRIMPDCHFGAGCVIGFTADLGEKVVPNLVGVDIGCLDSETEFLTNEGWKKIKDYKEGDVVLQYNKDNDTANFVLPKNYIVKSSSSFYHFKNSKGLDQMVSEEHKMLVWKGFKGRGYILKDFNPQELSALPLEKNYYNFKASFNIDQEGVKFSDDELRLAIMVSADGCLRKVLKTKNRIELHFKKERKINRAEEILNKLNIPYNIYYAKDETVYINFYCRLEINKDLSFIWKANKNQLMVIKEECLLWDGHLGYRSFFSTKLKNNADILQFAFSASNTRAGISCSEKGYYSVTPTKNNFVGVNTKAVIVPSVDGKKYCFTVPSGYFVARRNNNIFITGNCGMLTIELGKINPDLELLDKTIHECVPAGREVHDASSKFAVKFDKLQDLLCYRDLRDGKFDRSVGTLGSGNHFHELNKDDNGDYYLVIHSGSRNLGKQVADYYQRLAIDSCKGLGDFKIMKLSLIQKLKQENKNNQIQIEIAKLEKQFKNTQPNYPEDLCFLENQSRLDYLHDMNICQEYASLNRKRMAEIILKIAFNKDINDVSYFETIHNYIDFKDNIIRKGAVSAYAGEKLIIPINMRDGSIIATGKGNLDWNNSAPHGAGRLMGRNEAKRRLSLEEFTNTMKDVYTTTVGQSTLDEAPMAYKPIQEIIDNIQDTVTIDNIVKPVYNFKSAE